MNLLLFMSFALHTAECEQFVEFFIVSVVFVLEIDTKKSISQNTGNYKNLATKLPSHETSSAPRSDFVWPVVIHL